MEGSQYPLVLKHLILGNSFSLFSMVFLRDFLFIPMETIKYNRESGQILFNALQQLTQNTIPLALKGIHQRQIDVGMQLWQYLRMIIYEGWIILLQFKLNRVMNPFQRLRQTIDKASVTYTYQESAPTQEVYYIPTNQNNKTQTHLKTSQQTMPPSTEEINQLRQLYEANQLNYMRQINTLTSKTQQLAKSLKRAEASIENQLNEITILQKQNQQLKENLSLQYNNIVHYEDKERRYKQQIYRINMVLNELGTQINAERNLKKEKMREIEQVKMERKGMEEQLLQRMRVIVNDGDKIKSELQQRIQMFEYNVKKNAEDRKEYKTNISKIQQNYEKTLNQYRLEIDKLKSTLNQSKRDTEIVSLRKNNVEQHFQRIKRQLQEQKQKNVKLGSQVDQLKHKNGETYRQNSKLQSSLHQIEGELQHERNNIKVKVVQVRDEASLLQLQMYKRQCKQMMQEKAILNSINRSQRMLQPGYRIVSSELVMEQK